MLNKSLITITIAFLFAPLAFAQNIPVGEWRTHIPYIDILQVADGKEVIYAASEYGLYSVNKSDYSIEVLSKATGFSDAGIKVMKYNAAKDILVIVYKNLNIDLVKKGSEIVNIKDILRFSISGLKEVNDISFNGNDAYISTTFGIVVIDLDKDETKESFLNIGAGGTAISINSTTFYGDSIYAATNQGIRSAQKDKLLSDYNNWSSTHTNLPTRRLATFNNKLYADIDSVVRVYNGSVWTLFDTDKKIETTTMDVFHNQLVIAQSSSANKAGGIYIEDMSNNVQSSSENVIKDVVLDEKGNKWVGTILSSLILRDKASGQTFFIRPNSAPSATSFGMLSVGNELWVTSGGFETTLFNPSFNNNGFFKFENGKWTDKITDPKIDHVRDYTFIAQNPQNKHLFFASHVSGLIEYYNGVVYNVYNYKNSPLSEFAQGWTIVGGLAYDKNDNLWITTYNARNDSALHLLNQAGNFRSFKTPNSAVMQLIIDDFDQKWMVVRRGGGVGIAVFTDNGEPANTNVHEWKLLNTFPGNGGLPTTDVTYLAKDKDGEIWVGTNEGIAVFYNPGNVFTNRNFDASRIIITDGEFANYLLGNEVINTIVVDGGNRKWVGTNSGAWLLSPDGTETIHQFTTENSPLPSNSVMSIGINEKTGEVFFGTSSGIVSYRGDATEADDVHEDVVVFPNPVRPDYNGVITISGLPTNAYVKITDISGNVVYETIANGGTATWEGKNFNGERPKTGVYLVFTSSEDAEDTNVAKILFIN